MVEKKWYKKIPKWAWVVLGTIVLFAAAWLLNKSFADKPITEPFEVAFIHPQEVVVGKYLPIKNISTFDSLTTTYRWVLQDEKGAVLMDTDTGFHWNIPVEEHLAQSILEIHLYGKPDGQDSTYVYKSDFPEVKCDTPPEVGLNAPDRAGVGEEVTFEATSEQWSESFKLTWLLQGDTLLGNKKEHILNTTFDSPGRYVLQLNVVDESAAGLCEQTIFHSITIGGEKAFLDNLPVKMEEVTPFAGFRKWLAGLILAITGMLLAFFWYKWIKRKAPKPELKTAESKNKTTDTKTTDRAPYFIPFQDKNAQVLPDEERNNLSQVLRLRNIGQHQQLDVHATIAATVEKGGFPQIRFAFKTQPTDYLFLIEEQSNFSHQTALFKYLVQYLEDQEVVAAIFYYDKNFRRFWNGKKSQGIDLDTLQREHPAHRLIIFGDGHGLIDPYSKGEPEVKSSVGRILEKWSTRLLFTPIPPRSWTWREYVIFKNLLVFPADTDGLGKAAVQLSHGAEKADMEPDFKMWQAGFVNQWAELEINYRSWRTWADHEDHFKDHPGVLHWLKALSVWSNPSWETTIAIGKALEPFGVKVSYDNLLLLARIPWLQNGRFNPRLRFEMLELLEPEIALNARQAILYELEEVKKTLKPDSHAGLELETGMAIQQFALQPEGEEAKIIVGNLLDQKGFNKKQIRELDIIVAALQNKKETGTLSKEQPVSGIADYLEKNPVLPEIPLKPFFTPDLFKAAALSGVWLILISLFWYYEGKPSLYEWAFDREPAPFLDDRPLESKYYIIQEKILMDSVVHYNNLGVKANDEVNPVFEATSGTFHYNVDAHQQAIHNFKQALRLNPDYELASTNLGHACYNLTANAFNFFIGADIYDQKSLLPLLDMVRPALDQPAVTNNARHLRGLVNYYAGNLPQAQSILDTLEQSNFFDSLTVYPNLQTLLGTSIGETEILMVNITKISDNSLRAEVIYRLADSLNETVTAMLNLLTSNNESPQGYTPLSRTAAPDAQKVIFFVNYVPENPLQTDSVEVWLITGEQRLTSKTVTFKHQWPPQQDTVASVSFSFKGKVVDQEGSSIPDARVEVSFQPDRVVPSLTMQPTDTEGKFTAEVIEATPGLTYVLQVLVPDCPPYEIRYQQEDLEENIIIQLDCIIPPVERDNEGIADVDDNTVKIIVQIDRNMVLVEGGQFTMGCMDGQGNDCTDSENPVHEVEVSDFSIGKFEVTNEEFCVFLNEIGNKIEGGVSWVDLSGSFESEKCRIKEVQPGSFEVEEGYEKNPIIYVSWYGAVAYAKWLSQKTAKNYRLPTEAEWEFAARGGKKSRQYKYAGSNDIESVAWYDVNSFDKGRDHPDFGTHKVGGKQANELGLYDMSGNVYEWCTDWYSDEYYSVCAQQGIVKNPSGTSAGSGRVVRGGGWSFSSGDCRVSYRFGGRPVRRGYFVGFRLVHRSKSGPSPAKIIAQIESNMIPVRGGQFTMGCTDEQGVGCYEDEKPKHEVEVSDFYIGKFEVTNEEFCVFLNEEGNKTGGGVSWVDLSASFSLEKCRIKEVQPDSFEVEEGYEKNPINFVSWYGAVAYAKWLSQNTGKNYRLPTEAEWEFAARGGKKSRQYIYAGSNDIESVAWYDVNSFDEDSDHPDYRTHKVGGKQANELGLYDMSGNVHEWCSDWYGGEYYKECEKQGVVKDPLGAGEYFFRIVRGGSCSHGAGYCRVSQRYFNEPDYRDDDVGFRLAHSSR